MTSQQSSSNGQSQSYLSKKVIINGQFVTLYSVNGLTWLSSPEDLPDTMARLDNSRVTLADPKAEKDEKGEKPEKGEKSAKEGKEAKEKEAAPAPKLASSQYRMKGPKPRPILRQGGKVVEGPPIEPPSAAAVNMKAGLEALPQIKITPAEKAPRRGKLVAPIAQKRPGQVKPPKAAPAPKGSVAKGAIAAKGKAAPPVRPIAAKGGKKPAPVAPVKGKKVTASPAKNVKVAPPVKSAPKAQKAAKTAAAKPVKAKKSPVKTSTKKRGKR